MLTSLEKLLGDNIRRLREAIPGLTQAAMAARVDLSLRGYQRLEQGAWSQPETLQRIADELKVPVTTLFEPAERTGPTPQQALEVLAKAIGPQNSFNPEEAELLTLLPKLDRNDIRRLLRDARASHADPLGQALLDRVSKAEKFK